MKPTLRLNRETLHELAPEQLGAVVGASVTGLTQPTDVACKLFEYVASRYGPCTV